MNETNIHQKKIKHNIESVLITGAGGYLGGELIKQLSRGNKYKVYALTSNKKKIQDRFNNMGQFYCYDTEEWKNGKLPWENIDVLIHCAFARSSSGKDLAESLYFTNKIFKEAIERKVYVIINVSSQGVYGQEYKPLWTEDMSAAPDTLYGFAKYSSELLLNNMCEVKNVQIFKTNLRVASLSGGREGLRLEVVSKFVIHALNGEPIKIVGGNQVLSYMDVRDAASAIIALLSIDPEQWKTIYNLGSNQRCTILEIADLVYEIAERYVEYPVRIEIEEEDISLDVGMDSSLFYNHIHWRPKYDMRAIIESLFEYFKFHSI